VNERARTLDERLRYFGWGECPGCSDPDAMLWRCIYPDPRQALEPTLCLDCHERATHCSPTSDRGTPCA
jgi:hypothetical protein